MKNNIALIVNRDDVLFLKPIDDLLRQHNCFTKVYFTDFFSPGSDKKDYLKQSLKIMSRVYIAKYLFQFFMKYILKMLPLPKHIKKFCSLFHLCNYYGLDLIEVDSVNSQEFQDSLKDDKVEILLSITSQIYKKEILSIPNLKIYNFHPSLLPNNKGRFPIFWAILKKEYNGLTCHEINEKIDDGQIIHQKRLPKVNLVEKGMENAFNSFGDFVVDSLSVIQGEKVGSIFPPVKSYYGPTPSDEYVAEYKNRNQRGKRLVLRPGAAQQS